jgi:hypothetical protein
MKFSKFKYLYFFWGRRFGAARVGVEPQHFGRAYRRPQNSPSGALPATILGPQVEMLLGNANGPTYRGHPFRSKNDGPTYSDCVRLFRFKNDRTLEKLGPAGDAF